MFELGNILIGFSNGLISLVNTLGYLGIFVGMVLESSFFPLPSEATLIPAGALIAKGQMALVPILLLAVAGAVVGSLISYILARYIGREVVDFYVRKYGRFLFITSSSLNRADVFFRKHGDITTFVGRLIPVVRQLISLPAGFSEMNIFKFTAYTALGSAVWATFLTYLGYTFWDKIDIVIGYLDKTSLYILVILAVALILYLILRKNRKKI